MTGARPAGAPRRACWNCGAPLEGGTSGCGECGIGASTGRIDQDHPTATTRDPGADSLPWQRDAVLPPPASDPAAVTPARAPSTEPRDDTPPTPEPPPWRVGDGHDRVVASPAVVPRRAPGAEAPVAGDPSPYRNPRIVDVGPGAPDRTTPWSRPSVAGAPPTPVEPSNHRGPAAPGTVGIGPPPGPRPPALRPGSGAPTNPAPAPPAAAGGHGVAAGFGTPAPTLAPSAVAGLPVADRSTFVGIVEGPVSQDIRVYRFWGSKIFLPLLLITWITLLVVEAPRLAAIGQALLPLFILLVTFFVVLAVITGGTFGAIFGGVAKGTASAAGVMGRGMLAGAKGAARTGRSGSVTEQALPLRRFRVRSPLGAVQSCVMVGEVEGDDVRQGDIVEVHGRVGRDGHRLATRVDVLTGVGGAPATTVRARKPTTFRITQAFDVVARGASLLLGLGLAGVVIAALT